MRGSIAARTLRSTVQATGFVAVLLFGSSPAGFAQGVCGNGKIELAEACDDGNLTDGDGCNASCNVEQQCYDVGNTFSFFTWSDSYGSSGDDGVMTVMQDVVNVGAHPGRVAPRFWLATGDIPFMADGTQRLDEINDAISNSASGQRYPFQCSVSNGKFPYFVAIGNHDVDGYGTMTPTAQYSYWKNVVGPKLPGTLVGLKNFRWGPSRADGADANTTYSFDYKNAHFVIVNQYHGDPSYPTDEPLGCIRADMMAWIDQDLAQTTRPLRFVFGHEPAWSYCSTQGGYGGAYCPVGSLDNMNPAFRARPYSTQGTWFEPYGGHWGDSLEDDSCPAGSREAFWSLLARHDVIAHFNGHTHTYSGRLVKGDGTRRNDVHAYNKGGATFDSKDGVFGVDTGAVYNDGMSFVLTTVRDNLVTFESFDKLGNESMKLIETWSVRLGINPTVAITSPAAGAISVTPADLTVTAEAADLDGSVAQVAFYAGSTLLGVDTTSPYEVTWPGVAAGSYVLTAIATDDQGLATTSAPVSVTVTPPTSNHAPTLAPIGDQAWDELQVLSFTALGSDADAADTLTYSLVGGPTGSTISGSSGAFSWTPTEAQGPGSYRFTVRVKDNGSPALSADRTITVTVREINQGPVLAHIGNRSAAEGTALTIASSATDADLPANTLTYSLPTAPAGASISATSGVLSWTPSETQGGSTYSVTLRVTDNGSPAQAAEETFDVVVAETNQTPVLASISNKTVAAGATLTFTASATDGDVPANQLTYSLSGAPAGASIHPATGVFTWTTAPTDTGTRTFSVVVTDNATPPAAATRSLTVTLQPPIDLSVTALSTTATTINPGSSLSASNSVRNLGGTAAGASVVGFHLSADAVWGGADDVAFTQTRSITSLAASATSTASTSLTVPTSAPAGTYFLCAMADVNNSVGEGNEANNTLCTAATLQVTRPDLTTTQVDVGATTATAGGTLSVINSVRNQGLAAAGSSSVSFRFSTNPVVGDADDVLSATTRTIASLAVAATSQVTTSVAVPAAIPGGIYRVCVTADAQAALAEADESNNSMCSATTVSIGVTNHAPTLAPIGASTVDELSSLGFVASGSDQDSNTLAYSLVSGPLGSSIGAASGAFSWTPTEAQGPGVFNFTVRVTDNGSPALSADQPVSVTVREVNQVPVLAPIGNRNATEAVLLTFAASSSDADLPGNTLSYSLTSAPAGAAVTTGGIFSWTPAPGQGNASVTLRVTDNGSPALFAEETFAVAVTAANHPPTLSPIAAQTADELASLTFGATGSDPDAGNTLTYSLVSGPAGSSIHPATGAFAWTPTEAQGPGVFAFTVRVTDNGSPALSADQPVSVTVREVNQAPLLAPVGTRNATEGILLTFAASSSDADLPANTLTYSLTSAPAGAAISTGGIFSWTPALGQGNADITVRVTDNGSPSRFAEETFAVTVAAGNHPPTLAPIPDQTVDELAGLVFVATSSDPDAGNTLAYSLVGGPAGSSIDPVTGAFAWTPTEAQGPGVSAFTVRVTDNGSPALSADQPVSVTVREVNQAPVLAPVGNRNATEGVLLSFAASGSDADLPANALTYSLTSAPAGVAITAGGVFSWTPTESQGNASVTVRVTDNGSPVLFAEETFAVTVTAANHPPALAAIPPQAMDELAALGFVAAGSDPDAGNTLTYSLVGGPAGSSIDLATGAFVWTPTEAQGPGVFNFAVRVSDNGSPALSADQAVSVTVSEVNQAPVLAPVGNRNATEGVLLSFAASGSDADLPANALTYSLTSAPAGAAITAGGVFSWTPTESQGNASVTVRVTDNGSPVLFAEETFAVTVTAANHPPALAALPPQTVSELAALGFVAAGSDPDAGNTLTYSLVGGPAGSSIDLATGAFAWTPTEAQGPGVFNFAVRVTDNGSPALSADQAVSVTVSEVNQAPLLVSIGNRNATEGVLLSFAASASDPDLPVNTLTYSLTSAPAGASISAGGVFSWTPTSEQGNANVTVRVTDNGSPVLFAEETFAVTVTAANHPPVLAALPPQTVSELAALGFVAAGSDPDAGNTLTYSLVGGPAGSTIHPATGAFAWTPTEAQGPGVFNFAVRVTDNGSPALSADQPVSVTVNEVNQAPVLAPVGNRNATEGVLLTFAASGSDADLPANALTYSLTSAPAGASISAGGVFSWTPTESQGNSSVTVRVTDNGSPALLAEETFAIAVAETNQAPVLASISNKTVAAGGTVTFTASATDADVPANQLTFSLSGAPAAASIHPTTGAFTWTTTVADTGARTFSVVVTDNGVPPASVQTSVNVTVQGPTDLIVTALSTATTAVLPGGSLTASNSIRNQGSAAAGASVVGFHLSVDPVWGGADDIAFTQTRSLTSLAAATTSTANTSLTVPATTPLGAYYLCAMADVNNALPEGDEANNPRCAATTLQVTRPDLITTEVSPAATSAIAGSSLAVVNTVRNQGGLSASSTRVGFRFSTNGVVGDADDVTSNTTRTTGTLAGGASSQATTQVAVPGAIPAGSYQLCATADTQVAVVEADESNNSACSAATVVVAPPDLTVSAVSTTTTTLRRGTNLNLANTVANPGASRAGSFVVGFHLSVDASYGGVDDVAITKTRTISSLNAGATNAATTNNLTVPATTPAGSYYLCAWADTGASVVETDETNNGRCTGSTISVTP